MKVILVPVIGCGFELRRSSESLSALAEVYGPAGSCTILSLTTVTGFLEVRMLNRSIHSRPSPILVQILPHRIVLARYFLYLTLWIESED